MATGRARIENHIEQERMISAFRDDIRKGLSRRPRSIPSKYFYDEKGSRLFDEITRLPEYYLTRVETQTLTHRADEIVSKNRPAELMELGPGSFVKSRILLGAIQRAGTLRRFVPVDIGGEALERSTADLIRDFPNLQVHGIAGDFEVVLDEMPTGGPRLVAFLGSTIGNMEKADAVSILSRLARLLTLSDLLLLGTDLVKDPLMLEAAYNDSAGITAKFNRNVLSVINHRLSGHFDLQLFDHESFFNSEESRIETYLRAREAHAVRIEDLGMEISFDAGERIHTENSHKYTREMVNAMLKEAGLELREWFVDPDNLFALSLSGRFP